MFAKKIPDAKIKSAKKRKNSGRGDHISQLDLHKKESNITREYAVAKAEYSWTVFIFWYLTVKIYRTNLPTPSQVTRKE